MSSQAQASGADTELQLTTVIDRELPPVLESVCVARDLVVREVPATIRADAALVVSELVTNAVKHATGPVGLRVESNDRKVRISVHDSSVVPLGARDGYGLRIVEHLASDTGVEHDAHGKIIWADLPV